jgi:hypothetical protein
VPIRAQEEERRAAAVDAAAVEAAAVAGARMAGIIRQKTLR